MTRAETFTFPFILLVSACLFLSTVFLSFRGSRTLGMSFEEQILGVVLLFLGFMLGSALDAVGRRRASQTSKKLSHIDTFNPALIHEVIHLHVEAPRANAAERGRGELSSAELVGRDNALALAKLRIDIEQSLREMMISEGL